MVRRCKNFIKIYTDGCAYNNGRRHAKGGWAFLVVDDILDGESGWCENGKQTNNRYELMAIQEALRTCLRGGGVYHVTIFTDSHYAINALTDYIDIWRDNGWRNYNGRTVANVEILKTIDSMMFNMHVKRGGSVQFKYVEAHSGNYYNEMADRAAKDAAFENQKRNY